MEKEVLIEGIIKGSEKAFRYIYVTYFQKLCKHVISINKELEYENIVQEVICKLWENRSNAGSIKNIEAYLYKSVYFTSLNILRKEKTIAEYKEDSRKKLEIIQYDNISVTYKEEQLQALKKAINSLPTQCATVLRLKRLEGHTIKEISEMLDISERTVEKHISNALKQLRKNIRNHLPIIVVIVILAHLVMKTHLIWEQTAFLARISQQEPMDSYRYWAVGR